MNQQGLRLFDRPLRSDPVLRLWVVALALVACLSLLRNVELGASYNPDRVTGFLGDLVLGTLLSFLLLAWFPALVRWVWRYGNAYPLQATQERPKTWRPGDVSRLRTTGPPFSGGRSQSAWTGVSGRRTGRWGPTADAHAAGAESWADEGPRELDPAQPLGAGRASWTTSAARRSSLGDARPGSLRWLEPDEGAGPPPRSAAEHGRAPDVLLSVDTLATVPGVPVEVSWRADGAEYVTIEGLEQQLPSQGTLAVHLDGSRDVIVTAHNEHGTTSTRTEMIRVLPVPVLHAVRFPAMGEVSVNADVRVGVDWGDPVMKRMDRVLAQQESLRAERFAAPPHPVVPPFVIDAVRDLSRLVITTRSWRVGQSSRNLDTLPNLAGTPFSLPGAWWRRLWRAVRALLRQLVARRQPLTTGTVPLVHPPAASARATTALHSEDRVMT